MSRQIANVKYFLKNLQKNPQITQISQIFLTAKAAKDARVKLQDNLTAKAPRTQRFFTLS
jgi:hypothetical protein